MASQTRRTWVWVNSRSWWWTGRPGMLWFMGSQRVGHDWVTELNWAETKLSYRHAELRAANVKEKKKNQSNNAQACSLCSLSSLFSGKKRKKLTLPPSRFHSNKFPHYFISSISMEKGKYLSFLFWSGWGQNLSFALFDNHQLLSPGAHLSPTSNCWEIWTPRNLYWGDEGQMVIFCNFFNADMGLIDPI